jgi:ABC-type molybdate transport system substrate-binding protein
MAKYFEQYGDEVAIEPGKNVMSSVNVGVLKFTKNRDLAEKFAAFLTSEEGRSIFEKHSYRTERPK